MTDIKEKKKPKPYPPRNLFMRNYTLFVERLIGEGKKEMVFKPNKQDK